MRRRRREKRDKRDRKRRSATVGGFAFFSSLAMLLLLTVLNLFLLPFLLDESSSVHGGYFAAGCFIGCWTAALFVRGRLSVFLHEVRHAILSGLFGNRATGMKVDTDSGLYEYAYTDAEYNAFIALAPYFLPVFTVLGGVVGLVSGLYHRDAAILATSIGYGLDLVLNVRDISPRQTDISLITGGYLVGLAYILLMNLTIFTFLAAWVLQGMLGLKFLAFGLWTVMVQIVAYYRGYPVPL